jgi:hypothetical protein
MLTLAIFAVYNFGSTMNTVAAVSEPVAQDNINLLAGEYQYYEFSTPPGAVNAQVAGSVGVAGGVVPRILVYVMDASQCPPAGGTSFNFEGCNSYFVNQYLNDGGFISEFLPAGSSFYLLFYNDALLGERKVVSPSISTSSMSRLWLHCKRK